MGGFGSGNHREKKQTVGDCLILSCSWLLQHNYLDLTVGAWKDGGITYLNFFSRPAYTLDFRVRHQSEGELMLLLLTTNQLVYLRPTPLQFGGMRWWFFCPKCNRRCAKLYLQSQRSVFLCRVCLGVGYSRNEMKIEGYTAHQIAQGLKEEYWWRYPPWRRKRDRRLVYRDRGAKLREIHGDRIRM